MKKMGKLKKIFLAFDFLLAVICAIIFYVVIKKPVSAENMRDISLLSVSTLSIIFSVFFAALAVLIAAGDNQFVSFLQEFDAYTEIIWSYKYTVVIIFSSLISSIILYVISLFYISNNNNLGFPEFISSSFAFLVMYALFCSLSSAFDAIKYSEYRTKYLMISKEKEINKSDNKDFGN